ncbi:hypothetical protein MtrunA17_Chr8g0355881 [Medicago truncatula]|uniref:Transmembrane protein n=1 Tax=Medicago truncatula TaxID=3880 RepID=A0A396GH53_MEDTR|nr:hypothetical protein MtrunA17_Chr8g0355881 [Medicago truncatula]
MDCWWCSSASVSSSASVLASLGVCWVLFFVTRWIQIWPFCGGLFRKPERVCSKTRKGLVRLNLLWLVV